jgi:hypothetical protein
VLLRVGKDGQSHPGFDGIIRSLDPGGVVLRQEPGRSFEPPVIALLRLPRLRDRVLDQPAEESQIDEVPVPVDGIRRRRSRFGDNRL